MISIIIPVYNQAEKIIRTLRSIASQSYPDYEVIIVNDGSTDGVEKTFTDYFRGLKNDEHHYLFLNQANQGAPAARNRGEQEARGDYLFFCDADAILEPTALEALFYCLADNPSASYAYSSFKWGRKLFRVGEFDPDKLKIAPCIHTISLIRRADFPTVGWDESLKKFQDWDLWLTMLEEGHIGVWVSQVLFTVAAGGTMSSWLPSAAYKFLPFLSAAKKYRAAQEIIKNKHGLA